MCLGSRTLAQLFVGIQFTLLTDIKPLLSTFDPSSSKVLPPHIQRLAWSLHQHSFNIPHIPGKLTQQNRCLDYSDSGTVCEKYVRFVYNSDMLDLQAITLSDMRR